MLAPARLPRFARNDSFDAARRDLIRGRRRVGITVGAPAARPELAQVGFCPPPVPARPRRAREHFEIRPLAQRLDAVIGLVGLAAVLAPRRDDQLAHVGALAFGMTAGREQT